jgi:hypothetical protein
MEIFSIFPVTEEGIDGLPHPEVPYYALAKEGLFLHRKTQIGTVLIKQPTMPKNAYLSKLGHENGVFRWVGPKVPGRIIAQATTFFRSVYDKYQTEAEVIITMHNTTGEFKLFVPYQRVTGMGVKSIYEPTMIDRDYTVVGTLHSHCHFSAFHSGTDSADAAEMDGIHFTIGMLQNKPPEIVAMVTMNKKEFHYSDPSDVAELVFDNEIIPPWWDKFVITAAGNLPKPKRMPSITDEQWAAFCGTTPVSHVKTATWTPPTGHHDYRTANRTFGWYDEDDVQWGANPYYRPYYDKVVPFQPTKDSQQFNQKNKNQRHKINEAQTAESMAIDMAIDKAITTGVIMPVDWTTMEAHELDEISFWRDFYLNKLDNVCDILEMLGVGVGYNAKEIE